MELTSEMKKGMNFTELDKTYMPNQEKLPVVAYQIIKQIISFIVGQHLEIKRLEGEVRKLQKGKREEDGR